MLLKKEVARMLEEYKTKLPEPIFEELMKKIEEMKLKESEAKALLERAYQEYEKAIVEPCEAVGIVAAQSIGEPGTQLTLRTKHYAGAAEVSVGSGIQRVEEIVDGRSKTKYPSMTIYLNEKLRKDRKKAEAFAKSIIEVKLGEVAEIKENFASKTATIRLIDEKIEEKNLNKEEILTKVYNAVSSLGKTKKRGNTITIEFPKDMPLMKIRNEILKLERKKLQGITGIEKTIVTEENGEYVIKTLGTNLKAILRRPEVDSTRTITNDIIEISRVLGIEAGRAAIVNELYKVMKDNNIKVDIRHIMLVADLLTFSGEIRGTVRTGIMKLKNSPFARAAFEETVKHLFDAALYGETEPLQGVVENMIVGLPVKVGTGRVELIVKE